LITLSTVLAGLRTYRPTFALIVCTCVAVSVVVALLSRPVYRSEAVVAPVADDGTMSALGGLASQFGGLASFAGVSLGKGQNWTEAVATLRSRHLVERLVTEEKLLPVLFAGEGRWSFGTGGPGAGAAATMGDAVKLFKNSIMSVQEDAKTGLVTVRIQWYEREAAARWANRLVALADEELRTHAIESADQSLAFLKRELERTDGIELRAAISRLMEAQLKGKLGAGVRSQYAYRVIDFAVPSDPDKRVQPTRSTMVLAGTLFGFLLGILVVGIRAGYGKPIR
jgi:uncharacterized protein involved in exopolysaccharide biosynthesis